MKLSLVDSGGVVSLTNFQRWQNLNTSKFSLNIRGYRLRMTRRQNSSKDIFKFKWDLTKQKKTSLLIGIQILTERKRAKF